MGNYTLNDIAKFIVDYKRRFTAKPRNWMLSIPIVGKNMYERTYLENNKIVFFENKYYKALMGSKEEQQKFIEQMTPILDEFYSVTNENSKKI